MKLFITLCIMYWVCEIFSGKYETIPISKHIWFIEILVILQGVKLLELALTARAIVRNRNSFVFICSLKSLDKVISNNPLCCHLESYFRDKLTTNVAVTNYFTKCWRNQSFIDFYLNLLLISFFYLPIIAYYISSL